MIEPQRGFRQTMAWLHGWAGLILGWLLFAIAASGTASVFKGEIGNWMRPEISRQASQVEAVAAAIAYLQKAAPHSPAWYLTAPDARSFATIALYQRKDANGAGPFRLTALDPVTGRPDGIRDTLGGEFLYRFHFELQLPYPWGRILASAAGMLLLTTLISGIITHRRIFADFFTLRPGKGKRSWLDAHNALGVFAMPFHLMIAFTGVLTLITLTLPWAGLARYGTDSTKLYADLTPGYVARPASGRPAAATADVRTMLNDAVRRFGGGHMSLVTVDNPGDAAAVLRIVRNDSDQLADAAATATYDMASGRLIAFYAEDRPAKRTYDVLYGLHMGRFMPLFGHWLYFLCGLTLTATIGTGLVLWSRSRPAGTGAGHRAVARLTVGTVAAMPLAIAAFFWANRLLPIALTDRAEAEVRVFFLVWAAAQIAALFVRPRLGWIGLLGANAAAWGLLPILSGLVTGRSLFVSLAHRDWVFASFDLTAFALAACAALIVRGVVRHRPAVRTRRRTP